jgi:nucleoside-diphosphate-sugar epimerase
MIAIKGDKFLVTGGAGFIGSHIIEELLNQGKEVICLDNFVTGTEDNIFNFRKSRGFRLVDADICDLDKIKPWFNGVDVVFHNAASKCTVCRDNPMLDLDVNTRGAWNVFEASQLAGVEKVVHASTGSVYGEAVQVQDESHPYKPVSFYGVSKLAGERYLEPFHNLYGLRFSIIRYFHVFGPRQDSSDKGGVIPIFIRKALRNEPITIFGNGKQVRHFTYVKDDIDANFILANTTKTDGDAYNVANGVRVTILELAEKIIQLTKSKSKIVHKPFRKGDIRWFDVKSDKIKKFGMGYTDFDAALHSTISWYRDNL